MATILEDLAQRSGHSVYCRWNSCTTPFQRLGWNYSCVSQIAHEGRSSKIGNVLDDLIRADKDNIPNPSDRLTFEEQWNAATYEQRLTWLKRFEHWQNEYTRLSVSHFTQLDSKHSPDERSVLEEAN